MRAAAVFLLDIAGLSFLLWYSTELTYGSIALFFIFFWGHLGGIVLWAEHTHKKLKQGPLVIGQILEIARNGLVLNMTVQFRTAEGWEVKGKGSMVEPPGRLRPGMPIPLRYCPEKPHKLLLGEAAIEAATLDAQRAQTEAGPLVLGQLLSARPMGAYMEEGPLVELRIGFSTREGKAVTATELRATPAPPAPGTLLPLRYNPEALEHIKIATQGQALETQEMEAALKAYRLASGLDTHLSLHVMKNGTKATGEILSATPSGNVQNGYEEMVLVLKVTRPLGGSYETTVRQHVHPTTLDLLLPGSTLDVFYMPWVEKNIVVALNPTWDIGGL